MSSGVPGVPAWTLGHNHSAQEWQNRMRKRGWTPDQITEAIQGGQAFAASNHVSSAHSATRYLHPATGRSVVIDDVTREVIHVGGDGFLY
jgi:Colicin E5 ribonuclease domain